MPIGKNQEVARQRVEGVGETAVCTVETTKMEICSLPPSYLSTFGDRLLGRELSLQGRAANGPTTRAYKLT